VAVTDAEGGVHDAAGLDVAALLGYAGEQGTVAGFPGADALRHDELWSLECDYLVPAALGGVITRETNAARLRCRMLVEAANAPTTPVAHKILEERGILVVPDILANAGGVVVSYFEWTQNLQQMRWPLEQVRSALETRMVSAYGEVRDLAREREVSMRTAAYAIALRRVADAEELRGH
jgi:glutamate dehydrogenase/leucine dehydrogenase